MTRRRHGDGDFQAISELPTKKNTGSTLPFAMHSAYSQNQCTITMTKPLSSPSIGVRRRRRWDPKSPHSSSPTVSPAKRQRLLHRLPITPAAPEQATSADASSAEEVPARLPIDAVSASFLYLDVGDVPSASVICKDWNAAMKGPCCTSHERWLIQIKGYL